MDQYVNVLRQNCRCVELDIWDDEEDAEESEEEKREISPIITHGNTWTTKIRFSGNIVVHVGIICVLVFLFF